MEEINYFGLPAGIETGITDDCISPLGFIDPFVDHVKASDNEDSVDEDLGLLNEIEKNERDVSNFCISVRTEPDDDVTTQWRAPKYSDRMVGICGMIESQCFTTLTVPLVISHIADWFVFRGGSPLCSLSVKIKLKNMDDIIFNSLFVPCYVAMEELYKMEMQKEKKKRGKTLKKFKDYFEDLIETWALVDMTVTMVQKEEGIRSISVPQLLEFATTRVRLFSVLERLLLHHYADSESGASICLHICHKHKTVSKPETVFLEEYRGILKQFGDNEYREALSRRDGGLNNNTNSYLLLLLTSIQKLHRDAGRSAKRSFSTMNPSAGVISRNRSLPLPAVQGITDDAATEEDDEIEDATFDDRMKAFLEPALLNRIKISRTLEDMVEWDRRYGLLKDGYQKETGAIDY